ncbi:MAG: DUF2169 domain-containing protein [Saccharospirillaceae bacterium]|nr:DUF2169 domain-containing protein [Saccharospirillaceae bacterium]
MKIIKPLQISVNHQVLEQDNQFHLVTSLSMGIKYDSLEALLEIDYLKDFFECMGRRIFPDPGMPKPQSEFLVSGKFFANDGTPVEAGKVSIQLGKVKKELLVFGERQWLNGFPTNPEPMTELELDYHNAYGGLELDLNPIGKGFNSELLPQIENPNSIVTTNTEKTPPAGFTPLDYSWPQRTQYSGTYGDDYLEKYFPGYPADMDWHSFMMAPEDQWFDGFFEGTERFQIKNMHPEHRVQTGQLPGLFARCFIEKSSVESDSKTFSEILLNLDTVWFCPEKEIAQLIWRGGVNVQDDEAKEVSNLIVGYESLNDKKRSIQHYKNALERRLVSDDSLLNNFNTGDLIPLGHKPAMKVLQELALEGSADNPLADNLEAKAESVKSLVNEKVDEAIKEMSNGVQTNQNLNDITDLDNLQDLLKNRDDIEIPLDDDVLELKQNMEKLLPGITAGDPKKIDLSEFSFDKIEKITDLVQQMVDKKRDFVIAELDSAQSSIQDEITKKLGDVENLPQDQKNQFKESMTLMDDLKNQHRPIAQLPRLSKEKLVGALDQLDDQMKDYILQNQSENNLGNEQEELNKIQDQLAAEFSKNQVESEKKMEQAESDFRKMYLTTAHYTENGSSPHAVEINELKKEFLLLLQQGQSVANRDWACLDLSNENLDGIDLSNTYLEQVNFQGASLKGVNFESAILARAQLNDSDFSGSNLNSVNIGSVTAHNANFSHCNLKDAILSKGDFTGSTFIKCDLEGVVNLESIFDFCDFSKSNMPEFKFLEMSFNGLKLENCYLYGSIMIKSKFTNCNFSKAKMHRCTWAESSLENIIFDNADLLSNCWAATEPEESQLKYVSFQNANMEKVNLQFMYISDAKFKNVNLTNANCNDAIFNNADFTDANLKQCQFRNARLQGANFESANLMEGSLAKANLVGACFNNANLYAVDFLRCTLGKTQFHGANLDITLIKDWRPS